MCSVGRHFCVENIFLYSWPKEQGSVALTHYLFCAVVQKPNHVRITDFGLARLLEYKQDEYQAQSGKVIQVDWSVSA
jgi:hypothetical protein